MLAQNFPLRALYIFVMFLFLPFVIVNLVFSETAHGYSPVNAKMLLVLRLTQ